MANNLLVNGHTPLPGRQQPSPLVIKSRKSNFIMACLTHPFKSCQIRSTHRLNGRCWVFYCIKNKIIFVERTYFLSIQRSYSLHQSIPTSKLFFSFFHLPKLKRNSCEKFYNAMSWVASSTHFHDLKQVDWNRVQIHLKFILLRLRPQISSNNLLGGIRSVMYD